MNSPDTNPPIDLSAWSTAPIVWHWRANPSPSVFRSRHCVRPDPVIVFTSIQSWRPWRPDAESQGEPLAEAAVDRGVPRQAMLVTGPVSNRAVDARAVADQPVLVDGPLLVSIQSALTRHE